MVFDITRDFRRYRTIGESEAVFEPPANPSSKAARLPSKQSQEANRTSSYAQNLGREQHRFLLKHIRIETLLPKPEQTCETDGSVGRERGYRIGTGGSHRKLPPQRSAGAVNP